MDPRFPHTCKECKSPAYIGAYAVKCSNYDCRHRDASINRRVTLSHIASGAAPTLSGLVETLCGIGWRPELVQPSDIVQFCKRCEELFHL